VSACGDSSGGGNHLGEVVRHPLVPSVPLAVEDGDPSGMGTGTGEETDAYDL
jgi:hypothetical protein